MGTIILVGGVLTVASLAIYCAGLWSSLQRMEYQDLYAILGKTGS
jgi:hypothetical protein